MSENASTDSRPDESVLNRSTIQGIEIHAVDAFVRVCEEGRDYSLTVIRTTPAAARDLTPGETVEVVLRRVAAQVPSAAEQVTTP